MKKIIFSLLCLLGAVSVDAQIIKVYDNNTLVKAYSNTDGHNYRLLAGQIASAMTLSKTTMTVCIGTTQTLTATVLPESALQKTVTWISSNEDVATISSEGVVTAVSVGTATITATTTDGSNVSASCTVTTSYLLPGKFSVSASKQVQFTKSNIYWNGSGYRFEQDQTDYPTTWQANHIGHFYWVNVNDYKSNNAAYKPYADDFAHGTWSENDKLWCSESNKLTVEGTDGLYALTGYGDNSEWNYLFKGRNNASKLYKSPVTIGSVSNCLVIAPDDFDGTLQSSYTLEEANSLGLVCLPPAGKRYNSTDINSYGSKGYYYSSSPYVVLAVACELYFSGSSVWPTFSSERGNGYCLRLVRNL